VIDQTTMPLLECGCAQPAFSGPSGSPSVSVLFAREDSIYKLMANVDVWDAQRDARNFAGGMPVVAHPPCRAWGCLRHQAKPIAGEKDLAPWAVEQVRRCGGVLEHPAGSTLWPTLGLPEPGQTDLAGGWTLEIEQYHWGHRAAKKTRLYIVGITPAELPPMPRRDGKPTHVVTNGHGFRKGDPRFRSRVTDREREATPLALAQWLVNVARLCGENTEVSD